MATVAARWPSLRSFPPRPHGLAAASCDPDPGRLLVTYQPIDHSDGATHFTAQLVLANNDRRCVLDSDWSLYFNWVRRPVALIPPA